MDFRRLIDAGFDYLASLSPFRTPALEQPDQSPQDGRGHNWPPFVPKYADVCIARAMLKTLGLPTELVLQILEHAQYWPSLSFRSASSTNIRANYNAPVVMSLSLEADVLGTRILEKFFRMEETLKIRQIDFHIRSHDQGWTSEGTGGTFRTHSWTEVAIMRTIGEVRPHHLYPPHSSWNDCTSPSDLQRKLPSEGRILVARPADAGSGPQSGEGDLAWYLQGNRVACGSSSDYHVVWATDRYEGNEGAGHGERFVETLKEGDKVLVFARARYPQWQCVVDNISMRVWYGF